MIEALPLVPSAGCSLPGLSDLCGSAANLGTSLIGLGAGDVLGAVAAGVAQGASWLLGQVGSVIATTTSIDVGAAWFKDHYAVMLEISAVVLLPLVLAAVIQAVAHQSASSLLRTALVHLPLALLLGAAAIQLVQLALAATDALSSAVSSGTSSGVGAALSGLASSLAQQASSGGLGVPVFVSLLGALFVSLGAVLLWVELLVRSAAVYVATLFVPLALASLVWPAISGWCRRLVETLVALVLSKFVIVAVLSLAVGALDSGDSFAQELSGGALLLLAAFAPFTLLRLVPFVESGAVHGLEGVRQRVQQGALAPPRSAAAFALARQAPEALPDLGPGTDPARAALEAPGELTGGRASEVPLVGVPMWRGTAEPPVERPPEVGEDEEVRGPPPLWGAPLPGGTTTTERGTHSIGRDELGPVIRWRPGEPSTAEGRRDGG